MRYARIYPWRRTRRSRAPSNGPDAFFVAQFSAGYTPNIFGFDLRQEQVRVSFKDGKPQGSYENFVTGFWVSGKDRAEVWGRPAALAVAKDGSLLIADDTGARSGE